MNREKNYNKLFNANPHVGVLDPLITKVCYNRCLFVHSQHICTQFHSTEEEGVKSQWNALLQCPLSCLSPPRGIISWCNYSPFSPTTTSASSSDHFQWWKQHIFHWINIRSINTSPQEGASQAFFTGVQAKEIGDAAGLTTVST